MRRRIKRLLPLLAILLLLCGCARSEAFRTRSDLLGTVINLTAYGRGGDAALRNALTRVEEIHNEMSAEIAGNSVGRLNDSAGEWVAISSDTAMLLARSKDFSALTEGAFDPTIAPLVSLWDMRGSAKVPSQEEIDALLPLVDFTALEVETSAARLSNAAMAVDLGGIAKGYACDETVRLLRENGISRAVLDFGGNVYVMGEKSPGEGWKVGLRNPVIGEEGIIGVLTVSDTAVVTSGGYERFFEENGKLYHHILDPKTGYPAESGLCSVTIVCADSTQADALSTACFVLGRERSLALLEHLEEVEAILIGDDRSVLITAGLRQQFHLRDDSFFLHEGNL